MTEPEYQAWFISFPNTYQSRLSHFNTTLSLRCWISPQTPLISFSSNGLHKYRYANMCKVVSNVKGSWLNCWHVKMNQLFLSLLLSLLLTYISSHIGYQLPSYWTHHVYNTNCISRNIKSNNPCRQVIAQRSYMSNQSDRC